MQASGTFEVDLRPLESFAEGDDGITLGRMSINKTFSGDLRATSQGEMLTAITAVDGSAGYVAIEQVGGTLAGKSGRFVLQHFGISQQANSLLTLRVVPDSGSGDLAGLTGEMSIEITDDGHSYKFDYQLPV